MFSPRMQISANKNCLILQGGSALDAVCAAVTSLENNPVFNAGLGSCLTEEGTVEMDALIMDGKTMRVGKYRLFRIV